MSVPGEAKPSRTEPVTSCKTMEPFDDKVAP
jgi:hypothetical protein